jgi:hypothetical protein
MTAVRIDERGVLRIGQEPCFPVLARHMPAAGTPALLRDAGFHAYRVTPFGVESSGPEPIPEPLDGIGFWAYLFDRADLGKSPSHERELRDLVTRLRSHPSLLCYENYNEPTLLYKSDRPKTTPAALVRGTATVRELDPGRPIWLGHCCGNTVGTLRGYNVACDVVGCNPYPVYAPGTRRHIGMRAEGRVLDCIDQSIHSVGKYTEKMMAVADGRPVWMLVQAMANEHWFNPSHTPEYAGQMVDESKVVYPTYEQLRFMAFDAIVAGASGLGFAMYNTPVTGPTWEAVVRVVRELRELGPLLAASCLGTAVAVDHVDLGFSIWDGVRATARRKADEVLLVAVNTSADPARVSMRMPIDVDGEAVEGRRIVRDDFDPFGVRVYRFRAA